MRCNSFHAIKLRHHARMMRKHPTSSEYVLWRYLNARQLLGVSFRRQQIVLGHHIVDFLAPKLKLAVEVDGGYHSLTQSRDARRDRELERAGYRVLRLSDQLVLRQPQVAVALVRQAIEECQ